MEHEKKAPISTSGAPTCRIDAARFRHSDARAQNGACVRACVCVCVCVCVWGTRSLSHLHTAMEIEATAASHLHADLPEKVASSSPICYRAPRLIFFNDFFGGRFSPNFGVTEFCFYRVLPNFHGSIFSAVSPVASRQLGRVVFLLI